MFTLENADECEYDHILKENEGGHYSAPPHVTKFNLIRMEWNGDNPALEKKKKKMYKNPGSRLITFFVRESLSRRGWDGFCSSESVSASGSPIFDF